MKRPTRDTWDQKGFTLLELMVVLLVAGIVVAFAGPRVAGGMAGLGITSAAQKTGSLLRYARSKAANTGTSYYVIFDGAERRIILLQAKAADAGRQEGSGDENDADRFRFGRREAQGRHDDTESARPPAREKRIYRLPDGVFFERVVIADVDGADMGDEKLMMLTFSPNGTTRGAEITIADEQERRFFISVSAMTGTVTVREERDDV